MANRIAFTANEGFADYDAATRTYHYQAVMLREYEPGYTIVNRGWPTVDAAKAWADEKNMTLGHTAEDVAEIISSSLAITAAGS